MITVKAHVATTTFYCTADKTMVHAIIDLVCMDGKGPTCYRLSVKTDTSKEILYESYFSLSDIKEALGEVKLLRDFLF